MSGKKADSLTQADKDLVLAIKGNSKSDARKAINQGAVVIRCEHDSPRKFGSSSWTPLHWAAYLGKEDMVAFLLRRTKQVNLLSKETGGIIHGFCKHILFGHVRKVYQATAMYLASAEGHYGIVKQLMDVGADYTLPTSNWKYVKTEYVLQYFLNNHERESLDLSSFSLTDEEREKVKKIIKRNNSITSLSLPSVSEEYLRSLMLFMNDNYHTIEKISADFMLSISESRGKKDKRLPALLEAIGDWLKNNEDVTKFDLGQVRLSYMSSETEYKYNQYTERYENMSVRVSKSCLIMRLDHKTFQSINNVGDLAERNKALGSEAQPFSSLIRDLTKLSLYPDSIDAEACFEQITAINQLLSERDCSSDESHSPRVRRRA